TRRRTLQKHDVRAYPRRGRLPPALCGMVSETEQARQVPHVWTLHGPVLAGSDPAPVRLPGAAEFSAALQRGADAAGADRPHRGGAAAIRARALGPDPSVGQGPAEVLLAHQCARGIGERQGGVPQRHAPTPLPRSRRWFLRLEGRRPTQTPIAARSPQEVARACTSMLSPW